MDIKLINSQLTNYKTYLMKKRQLMMLAKNVILFKYMPDSVDIDIVNDNLICKGSIAFFVDEVMGLLALPYRVILYKSVTKKPSKIEVIGDNGYKRILRENEFVIMYDNTEKYPLYDDIIQYAERLALDTKTIDINIVQQRTPRIWKTSAETKKSVEDIINNVDGAVEKIVTYDGVELADLTVVLEPAPYIADKVEMSHDKLFNEYLRFIGIANLSYQKKERNIKDEINAMQGGTVASRFSRFSTRKKAVDEINKKFADILENKIEVTYYDGLPTTKEDEENEENEGGFADDTI